jgi:serine/threonine protein kinase
MPVVAGAVRHERYEVVAVVGRGSGGTVVRALDRRHGREVALKLRPVRGDAGDMDHFLAEAGTLLSLRPHPGLPLARDDFFEGGHHVPVVDWVRGVDLGEVVRPATRRFTARVTTPGRQRTSAAVVADAPVSRVGAVEVRVV